MVKEKQIKKNSRFTMCMSSAPEIEQILNKKTLNLNTLLINGNVFTSVGKIKKKNT